MVSLLPGRPEPVESQLSAAFADSTAVMDEVLVRCKDVLTKRSPLHVPEYYQLEYESDEETFDAGYDRYEATVSRVSLFKVRIVSWTFSCFRCVKHTHFVLWVIL